MAKTDITINGRIYPVSCEDGQEDRLVWLGKQVDERVQELVLAVGQVGDTHLLVLAGLLLADELADTRSGGEKPSETKANQDDFDADALGKVIERLAARIENIAERIEQA